MKKLINYIKSLEWGKEDVKKILMFVIMLVIACVILNKFLKIRVKGNIETNTYINSPVGIIQ